MIGVFDTVILVRGLINPFGWCGRLVFEHFDAYELVVSPAMVSEYLSVLARPKLGRKYRSAENRDLAAIFRLIASATIVQPAQTPAICRDPSDDKFLAAAKTALASFIISEDRDLLDLGSYEDIQIVNAETIVRLLEDDATTRG